MSHASGAAVCREDLTVRRDIAGRGPANVMGVRFFGQDLADRLVRALRGGNRHSERP